MLLCFGQQNEGHILKRRYKPFLLFVLLLIKYCCQENTQSSPWCYQGIQFSFGCSSTGSNLALQVVSDFMTSHSVFIQKYPDLPGGTDDPDSKFRWPRPRGHVTKYWALSNQPTFTIICNVPWSNDCILWQFCPKPAFTLVFSKTSW